MLIFIVPLRSPESCSDWGEVSSLCNSTLRSLTQQTSSKYKILLVCNVPPLNFVSNEHIILVEVSFPIPNSLDERNEDIYNKVKRGMLEVRNLHLIEQNDSIFIMKVDADDLVSNKIVAFTEESPNSDGWFVSTGYIHEVGRNYLFIRPRFDRVSGTSHIFKCNYLDFPESMGTPANEWMDCIWQHQIVNKLLESRGKKLRRLPFPGAVYRINSQNFSSPDLDDKRFSSPKAIIWKMLCKRQLTSEITNEFGFPKI